MARRGTGSRGGITVLERSRLDTAPPPRVINVNPPQQSSRTGGSPSGGPVILIASALFIGYLFITQRLQGAYNALFGPPGNKGGLQPYVPTSIVPTPSGGGAYPRTFSLMFPAPYTGAGSVTISAADKSSCDFLVSSATLEATGSLTLAAMNTRAFCP